MIGRVDEDLRALLDVNVSSSPSTGPTSVSMWIDTAFIGHFVFPQRLIEQLGLEQFAAADAVLADGSRVTLESYVCYVEWFGSIVPAQVIANEGKLPLLGTELLSERTLHIEYATREMTLD